MQNRLRACLITVALVVSSVTADAQPSWPKGATEPILPPEIPWKGASIALIAPDDDPWVTPAEAAGFRQTPSYDETVAWLRRLVAAAPELHMLSIGKSPEQRDIWMVVASKERAFTPEALRSSGKPLLLAQAGIHSGEIDGKDAGMMLLRDMTVRGTKRQLLERANVLFVPIFNVDGHERASRFNRINQRGPDNMGWRNNSRNLNLNRDYMKAVTLEMQAMIRALERWDPDLYLDIHVTDGADYQYDVTYGYNTPSSYSPAIAGWLDSRFSPALNAALTAAGHIPGPLVFAVNNRDMSGGNTHWMATPRFSNGYGDVRHLPTVLIENHSLKPYRQRVLGTYVLLESTLRTLAGSGSELKAAIRKDREHHAASIPLAFAVADEPPRLVPFAGIESRTVLSSVSGTARVVWTGKPVSIEVPLVMSTKITASANRPKAYWIHPAWHEVIERLEVHGIVTERITSPRTIDVEMYRISEAVVAAVPVEGQTRVKATSTPERRRETFPAGSVRVSMDQPLAEVAMLLLEPDSPDSFFQWGFFKEILTRIEYVEGYVMEPMAEVMLRENPELAREFELKLLSDAAFRGDSAARLQWFYEKTPFFDERWMLYPVARE